MYMWRKKRNFYDVNVNNKPNSFWKYVNEGRILLYH